MIKIILLCKIKNLGILGNIVLVKSGYAQNFLFPKGYAIPATSKNLLNIKKEQKKISNIEIQKLKEINLKIKKLTKIKEITIISNVGTSGKLFGSIGIVEILKKLFSLGLKINKNQIFLPNGPLKKIGKHKVVFQPNQKIKKYFIVNIIENKKNV
ncbi:50S ribosomal protein L9 [Buchnera aphidicola]|uniref:50S ribosomal protein L9 n=1 Tax=Buchnera aphidicola TaxID=9 RepID=UPI0030EF4062